MLRVIEPGERNQQWLGVADIMKAEQTEAANAALDKFTKRIREVAKIAPERIVREGVYRLTREPTQEDFTRQPPGPPVA